MTTAVRSSARVRYALFGAITAVLVLLALPETGEAQAGTNWRKCREQAWADYNSCLMEDLSSTAHHTLCFFAWDLDNVSCDVQLLKELLPFI